MKKLTAKEMVAKLPIDKRKKIADIVQETFNDIDDNNGSTLLKAQYQISINIIKDLLI